MPAPVLPAVAVALPKHGNAAFSDKSFSTTIKPVMLKVVSNSPNTAQAENQPSCMIPAVSCAILRQKPGPDTDFLVHLLSLISVSINDLQKTPAA